MNQYKAMLETLSRENSSTVISNSSTEHAAALIEALVRRAKSTIRIFSGSLSKDVYANKSVVDAFISFLSRDSGFIEIIIQSPNSENEGTVVSDQSGLINKLLHTIGTSLLTRVSVFKADDALEDIEYHFMVVDGTAYRFEPDKTKHVAFATFNGVELGKKLNDKFDQMLTMSRQNAIAIPH
jgi:hypothetical protein